MPNLIPVYRVEHATATGRYCGPYGADLGREAGLEQMWSAHNEQETQRSRPAPSESGIAYGRYGREGQLFGCASLAELRAWFAGYLATLAAADFVIRTYLVDEEAVHRGNRQLVFDVSRSFPVSTQPVAW